MTDAPVELRQMREGITRAKPSGHVLIGGLGLGIAASWLCDWFGVKYVTVVELHREVITLVLPHIDWPWRNSVLEDDIKRHLLSLKNWPYRFAFLDTWTATNEGTWWDDVLPLRRIIANKFGRQNVYCWGEDQMRSQIVKTLVTCEPHWHFKNLNTPMSERNARFFVNNVGLPLWEKRYSKCLEELR
jgi:hypothetical protein